VFVSLRDIKWRTNESANFSNFNLKFNFNLNLRYLSFSSSFRASWGCSNNQAQAPKLKFKLNFKLKKLNFKLKFKLKFEKLALSSFFAGVTHRDEHAARTPRGPPKRPSKEVRPC
jgi:hypothetical protein